MSLDDSPEAVQIFRAGEWKMPWLHTHVGADLQAEPLATFELIGVPYAILVDADGRIVASGQEDMLGEKLREKLAEFFGEID